MNYEKPKMELVNFESEDVIRTSDPLNGWDSGEGNDNWTPRT